jgi:hypothetical protein
MLTVFVFLFVFFSKLIILYLGALLCIPDTYGGGTYADAAHNGIGILRSWINGGQ